jgi:hypothetical protein
MSIEQADPNSTTQPTTRRAIPSWLQDILDRASSPPQAPLQFWHPPEDPYKPTLPYTAGFTVQIQRCQVPTAAALRPACDLSRHYLRTVTQSEAIIAGSSIEFETENADPAPSRQEMAELVVTAPLAIGAARGAQVVAVTVTQNGTDTAPGKSFEAVAKIYDPLYYSFESEIGHHPENCVYSATSDFIKETTAYEFLQTAGQTGAFTPEYYGCWRFSLPITIKGTCQIRSISLILIERLKGDSILSTRIRNNPNRRKALDSFHYPEEFRLEVLARAMEGYVRLLRAGIVQRDFAARNLILVTQNRTNPAQMCGGRLLPRVVLIDYNHAYMLKNTSPDDAYDIESPPPSPATVFWVEYLWRQFPGWVPHEWEDITLQRRWLLERFTGPGQRELYLPVEDLEL